jgi:diacylglycerol O-acyltransferase
VRPRLSPLDGSFLRVETRNAHMHVAWVGMFRPDPKRPRPTIEGLRESVACRLHQLPRFRQRVASPPPGFGEPFWVDDAEFDVAAHVTALTEPDEAVTCASFGTLCDALLSEPLDRRRPLWHLYLVPQLEDGNAGLIGKLHHAMVDGVSVVELGLLLFDESSEAPSPERTDGWASRPEPGPVRLALEALADDARLSVRVARSAGELAVHPRRSAARVSRTIGRAAVAVRDDLLHPARLPSEVNPPIGPQRTLVRHREPLGPLLRIRQAAGVTLNDVCLAIVAGALRDYARRRGEAPRPLKVMVPVSVRADDELADLGNRISFAFIDLPLDVESPSLRLRRIHQETMDFKRAERPAGTEAVLRALGLLPGPLKQRAAQLAGSARVFNLVVSNIPGPGEPVYMQGAELVEAYPVVPLAEDHALSVGMFSYRDELFFGLYADPAALPDVGDLPEALHAAAAELAEHGPRGRFPRRAPAGVR